VPENELPAVALVEPVKPVMLADELVVEVADGLAVELVFTVLPPDLTDCPGR
jgi:hypothetical protein